MRRNEIPHFNATSHFRTQSHEDARRRLRRAKAAEEARARAREEGVGGIDENASVALKFIVVSGALVAGLMLASTGGGWIGGIPPAKRPRVKEEREKQFG